MNALSSGCFLARLALFEVKRVEARPLLWDVSRSEDLEEPPSGETVMEVAAHLVSKGLRAVAINAASAYQAP